MPERPAALTHDALFELAGEAAFDRALRYAAEGRVRDLAISSDSAQAKVDGTRTYTVRLDASGYDLTAECDCPAAADADMCKHAVAVGLAWLGEAGAPEEADERPDELRAYLRAAPPERLVDLVLDLAARDPGALLRLRTEAAAAAGTVDVAALRKELTRAIAIRGFVDYRDAADYADGVDAALGALDALLAAGQPAPVVTLAEHAMARLETARNRIDDSGGEITYLAGRLRDQHLEACRRARPSPAALAKRLFQIGLRSDLDWFRDAPERYADVLGDRGLAAYRRLAEEEWARVEPLAPDSERRFFASDHDRFAITKLMESLARACGDVEGLVEVMARDLSSSHAFVRIGAALLEAGRNDDALDWIERGLNAYGAAENPRLRELAVAEYRRRGEPERAVALALRSFDEEPRSGGYAGLRSAAEGRPEWPELRARALAALSGDDLIWAHLIDGDPEAAWLEAMHGGASGMTWMELAERRRATHPDDALPIYRRALERDLQHADARAYQEVVNRLKEIRTCLELAEREHEFEEEVSGVRAEDRRRPNLMALLDAQGW